MENKLFEFIVEQGRSYVCTEVPDTESYMFRMLLENDIPGLIRPEFKSDGDRGLLAFPVHELTFVADSGSRFDSERIRNLVSKFIEVYRGMEDYMLPFAGLSCDPLYIFEDEECSSFSFIYSLFQCESENGQGFSTLFDFLLDNVDRSDMDAVKMVYMLHQAARDAVRSGKGQEVTQIVRDKAAAIMGDPAAYWNRGNEFEKTEEEERKLFPAKSLESVVAEPSVVYSGSTEPPKSGKTGFFNKVWNYLNEEVTFGKKKDENRDMEDEISDAVTGDSSPFVRDENGGENVYILDPVESADEKIMLYRFPFFMEKARIDKDKDGNFFVTDLCDKVGSFLNGKRIYPYEKNSLCAGDSVVLAQKEYIFKTAG